MFEFLFGRPSSRRIVLRLGKEMRLPQEERGLRLVERECSLRRARGQVFGVFWST